MYKHSVSAVDSLIVDAEKIVIERMEFLRGPLKIVEEFTAQFGVIFSMRRLLNIQGFSLEDYSYEIYVEKIGPFVSSLIQEITTKFPEREVRPETLLLHYEMVVRVDGYIVARVLNNMYPKIFPLIKETFQTEKVPAFIDPSIAMTCFGASVHLVILLRQMYLPANAEKWQDIFSKITQIMGREETFGYISGPELDVSRARMININRQLKRALEKRVIFIGSFGTKVEAFPINELSVADITKMLKGFLKSDEEIIVTDQFPRIPQDFRLRRSTFYIAAKRDNNQKTAILDLFNTTDYELIPTMRGKRLYAGDSVRMRFRLIDLVTIRVFKMPENVQKELEQFLYTRIKKYYARLSERPIIDQQIPESYRGKYYDQLIYQKQTKIAQMKK